MFCVIQMALPAVVAASFRFPVQGKSYLCFPLLLLFSNKMCPTLQMYDNYFVCRLTPTG